MRWSPSTGVTSRSERVDRGYRGDRNSRQRIPNRKKVWETRYIYRCLDANVHNSIKISKRATYYRTMPFTIFLLSNFPRNSGRIIIILVIENRTKIKDSIMRIECVRRGQMTRGKS